MGKKLVKIAVLIVIAGVAFGGSFAASMMLHRKRAAEDAAAEEKKAAGLSGFRNVPGPVTLPRTLRDEQIDGLARNLRERMTKVIEMETKLETRREQMDTIQAQMETDRRELEGLYTRVMGAVVELKKERADADAQVIRMTKEEEARLAQMAEIYDKMEATKSGKMIETMYGGGTQREDAIKILYFMNPRTAAEALSAIENAQLSAAIVEDFKRVKELASTGE